MYSFKWSQPPPTRNEIVTLEEPVVSEEKATETFGKVSVNGWIYHNGVSGWKTSIKAVKDKYPK